MVYALDIHPLAIRKVERIAQDKGLTNVKTILSDCRTGLLDGSVNVVLLYDIFHMLGEPAAVLAELHRILASGGTLSCDIDHMSKEEAIAKIVDTGLFELAGRGKRTLSFSKR
jgi:ubiquinone/menaquinone biosynthesis C-methylase UbiE